MDYQFEDIASLEEWFYENETCFVIPYIEKYYKQVSINYEYEKMLKNLIYTKTIIMDDILSNDEKINELIDNLRFGKSKIIMIVGSRGSGKTATALLLAEKGHEFGGHKTVYYVGKPEYEELYPKWIRFVDNLDELPPNCLALIDEAAIKYNARRFRSQGNVELTEKMTILRHQNITLILITQNIQLVEINVDRLADIMIYKMGVTYGFRKKRGEVMREQEKQKMMIVSHMKPRTKEECLVEYLSGHVSLFRKFKAPLPSFWDDEKISKAFANFKHQQEQAAIIKVAKSKKEVKKIPYMDSFAN